MTTNSFIQITIFFSVLLILIKPLGSYMAGVYEKRPFMFDRFLGPVEKGLYRLCGVRAEEEMTWPEYAISLILFNIAGFMFLFALLVFQGNLPLNPRKLPSLDVALAFNVAVR